MSDIEDFIASAQFDVDRDSASDVIHAATLREWFNRWQAAQAQASKPIAAVHGWYDGRCVIEPLDRSMAIPVGMALYSQPQAQATPWKYDAILDKFMPDFKAQARDGEVNLLAKNQDCGCVICTCENDERCMGCGAKHCGTHPVGRIPNPRYEQAQAGEWDEFCDANCTWLDHHADCPIAWMRSDDVSRTMIATEGERAEVAPDKEGDFDVPLYRHPQPAQVNQQLLELQEDLDETLRLLADWAVAVRDNGAGWDYWDDYYKETMYGNLRVRKRLDAFIAETFERDGSSAAIAAAQEKGK